MIDLKKILSEVSTNKISEIELEEVFDRIAVALFCQTKLVAGQEEYLIKEIEFYFSGEHYKRQDSYSHSSQYKTVRRQEEFGEWYFHRYKSVDTYLKQKYRGLDLTFGNKELKNSGSILIRQLQSIKRVKNVNGISKIVGVIIEDIGFDNLHKIAIESGQFAFDINSPLHLEEHENLIEMPIYKSTRILPKPDTDKKENDYKKLYRYFNHMELKRVDP